MEKDIIEILKEGVYDFETCVFDWARKKKFYCCCRCVSVSFCVSGMSGCIVSNFLSGESASRTFSCRTNLTPEMCAIIAVPFTNYTAPENA